MAVKSSALKEKSISSLILPRLRNITEEGTEITSEQEDGEDSWATVFWTQGRCMHELTALMAAWTRYTQC